MWKIRACILTGMLAVGSRHENYELFIYILKKKKKKLKKEREIEKRREGDP
jgi:hypothetical protein